MLSVRIEAYFISVNQSYFILDQIFITVKSVIHLIKKQLNRSVVLKRALKETLLLVKLSIDFIFIGTS
jgi:hypothetical protein